MTIALPEFQQTQYQFSAYIRQPEQNPAPQDVELRRMQIYQELFYNNIRDFLTSGFPVIRSLYRDDHWHSLVRDFYAQHTCQTPLFLELYQEFLDYLQNERQFQASDPPFLIELAHYEWMELAISISQEENDMASVNANGDLLAESPVLSVVALPLSYQYPVHKISPEFQPQQTPEQATFLIVYRDRQDQVGFIETNPITHRLLSLLQQHPNHSGLALMQIIINELQHPNPEVVIQGGQEILAELQQKGVIVGTKITDKAL